MAHALHLPHTSSSIAALGVAACLAGAGAAVAVEEIADGGQQSPQVQAQPVPTPAHSPSFGPASGCYPKWGC
jgi:hypothetical protein